MKTKEELEQEIIRKESFIEEEQRCLNYCLSNPDETEEDEIEDRQETIGKLLNELEKMNQELNEI